MNFEFAQRLTKIPPYLFAGLNKKKAELKSRGVDIIDFGVGDPDLPTSPHVIQALTEQADDPENHRYPSYEGLPAFRQAVAKWYGKRFEVKLSPDDQVTCLMGAKDGLAHAAWALFGSGDKALCPDPAYPVYAVQTMLAGAEPVYFQLSPENSFLPDIDKLPIKGIKAIFLCYPNNPTAAVADIKFYQRLVDWATKHNIMILNDGIYSEIAFDGLVPPSILQIPGAEEIALEFHSLSKSYNMTGWRVGMAVGNKKMLQALMQIKTNSDSGVFQAVQYAAIAALEGSQDCVKANCRVYQERRDVLAAGLKKLGLEFQLPKATFYFWLKTPSKYDSLKFTDLLLEKAGVMVAPGVGFGQNGEGFVRMALTIPKERMAEAIDRMGKIL
ncbi:LL-diaminopimelate aminotransferase [candidate division TA06 bacterium]|uniref:Aminotransferase n=1 Tax=candidate division TA06 bacterium TaxID=2250710 RepID=A0A933I9G1_UNCT6|nr:LL-diaminopimelate aminotransferase [candidate division TA06 bacterium]